MVSIVCIVSPAYHPISYPLWLSWLKRPTVIHRQSGDRKFEPSRGSYFLLLLPIIYVHTYVACHNYLALELEVRSLSMRACHSAVV